MVCLTHKIQDRLKRLPIVHRLSTAKWSRSLSPLTRGLWGPALPAFQTIPADLPAMNEAGEARVSLDHATPPATVQVVLAKPERKIEMVVNAAL